MVCHVYKVLQVSFILLAKSKHIRGFDDYSAFNITYAIYSTLIMQNHLELLALAFVIKFDQYSLILDKS